MSNQQLRQMAKAKLNRIMANDPDIGDVDKIREMLPFMTISALKVKTLWQVFSADYCAGWLIVSESTCRDFVEWIGGGDD